MTRSITLTEEVIDALDVVYEEVYEYWQEEDSYAIKSGDSYFKGHADGIAEALSIIKGWRA
tara:strand:- start:286 stop:468 length:183 start_codon:yes stop_codon:yes gene_type:complete